MFHHPTSILTNPATCMPPGEVLLLSGSEVSAISKSRLHDLLAVVAQGTKTSTREPQSAPVPSYFPLGSDGSRFFGLAGKVPSGEGTICGCKWIGSFPGNLRAGRPRASAVIILNNAETGYPVALMEGTFVSMLRTALGAIHAMRKVALPELGVLGLVGIGPLNRFVCQAAIEFFPRLHVIYIADIANDLADKISRSLQGRYPEFCFQACSSDMVFSKCEAISIATNQLAPHLSLKSWAASSTPSIVLHLSLRDLFPHDLALTVNVTDSIEHVVRLERQSLWPSVKASSIGRTSRLWKRIPYRAPPVAAPARCFTPLVLVCLTWP